ncbi:MAG TPA: SRPBCC family protein [Candidatus Limnocylindria bacterium]|nr:SRPBCC family protein [Candidatus Limnocylindria bacterium]
MGKVEASIDVNVPVSTAYNQWTQFEEFPQFMEGVKQVRQLDDRTLEWTAEIAGNEETWRADISEQEPDQRIAWHSTEGAKNAGVITFHRIDDNTTRLMLQLDFEPEGAVEKVGDAMGIPERRVKGDLERFKEFIESRGSESGAWRGRIEQTRV